MLLYIHTYTCTDGIAASGLGSPNFGVIANLVLNVDTLFPSIGTYPLGTSDTITNTETTSSYGTDAIAKGALAVAVISMVMTCVLASKVLFGKSTEAGSSGGNGLLNYN